MKPDSMLVEPEHINSARREMEPALASFLCKSLASFAGTLSLSGAPTELVQGSHEEVLTVGPHLRPLYAPRPLRIVERHHSGTRLAQLDPSLETKPQYRRKQTQPNGTPQEEGA